LLEHFGGINVSMTVWRLDSSKGTKYSCRY